MTEQDTINRIVAALGERMREAFSKALGAEQPAADLPIDPVADEAFTHFVLSSLRPGDVLPGGMMVEQGWRPIETAPKDGTIILLCHATDGFPTVSGYWGLTPPAHNPGVADEKYPWVILEKTNGCNAWSNDPVHGPTHWMPLPAQPKEGE